MKLNFTKKALEAILSPAVRLTYHDTRVPGLVLMVTPNGAKTFYLYRRIGGRPERIRLGTFPSVSPEQARQLASKINAEIASGANPAAARRAVRTEPTFGEAFEQFLTSKRLKDGRSLSEKTIRDYRNALEVHAAALTKERLSSITPERLRTVHHKVESPARANHIRAIFSSVFEFAKRENLTSAANPARILPIRHVPSRDRFLQANELPRFFEAVADSPLCDFFLLALLTGARRSNLQAMRWQDVDFDEGVWHIPSTKNGTPQNVTLVPLAVEILKSRYVIGEAYVFPGSGITGHLVEPKKAFNVVLKKAGIEGLRFHDLRRTLGSWQAKTGASLAIIGKSLNHKTHQATAIYARLDLDPVRQSVNAATSAMLRAAEGKPSADVVEFSRKEVSK
jgi:integrase